MTFLQEIFTRLVSVSRFWLTVLNWKRSHKIYLLPSWPASMTNLPKSCKGAGRSAPGLREHWGRPYSQACNLPVTALCFLLWIWSHPYNKAERKQRQREQGRMQEQVYFTSELEDLVRARSAQLQREAASNPLCFGKPRNLITYEEL